MSTTASTLLWRNSTLHSLRSIAPLNGNRAGFYRLASTSTNSPSADAHEKSVVNFAVLNGPKSTLPGELELPPRTPDSSLAGHLFRTGKAYVCVLMEGMDQNLSLTLPLGDFLQGWIEECLQELSCSKANQEPTDLSRRWDAHKTC